MTFAGGFIRMSSGDAFQKGKPPARGGGACTGTEAGHVTCFLESTAMPLCLRVLGFVAIVFYRNTPWNTSRNCLCLPNHQTLSDLSPSELVQKLVQFQRLFLPRRGVLICFVIAVRLDLTDLLVLTWSCVHLMTLKEITWVVVVIWHVFYWEYSPLDSGYTVA